MGCPKLHFPKQSSPYEFPLQMDASLGGGALQLGWIFWGFPYKWGECFLGGSPTNETNGVLLLLQMNGLFGVPPTTGDVFSIFYTWGGLSRSWSLQTTCVLFFGGGGAGDAGCPYHWAESWGREKTSAPAEARRAPRPSWPARHGSQTWQETPGLPGCFP